ncbi:MAG: glutamine-synthetase adenylyltransferase [Terriglobia bacterium]
MLSLLDEIQFRDPVRARPEIAHMQRLPPPARRVVKALLPSLPDPDESVHYLNRLMAEAPEAALTIAGNQTALRYALTIFSYSHFLAEAVLRYPEWILDIANAGDLHRGFLEEEYERLLRTSLPQAGLPRAVDLALFRRRQILRIVLRDTLRLADLSETAEDLSSLAEAILNVAWQGVRDDLAREVAAPCHNAFSVIALGKLGGRELNYSSDIDLMFVYGGQGSSSGPDSKLTVQEFFRSAANRMTALLSTYTPEGMCYRVDLRLRPDGSLGEVCQPLEGAKQYYATRGRDWELQMLIKARVAAGDPGPGRELLEFVQPLIYRTTTDFRTIEAVSETRARIHEKHARRAKQDSLDVKLTRGGIRDIEFLVQCLQRLHGGLYPWVRQGGTLRALGRLRDKGLLSSWEYSKLANAYQFMRHLEHRLQFDEDLQTHTLPSGADRLELLGRKMPPGLPGFPGAGTLERELDRHLSSVQDLYDRVIHSHRPIFDNGPDPAAEHGAQPLLLEASNNLKASSNAIFANDADAARCAEFPSVNLSRYLELRAPSLARLVSNGAIRRSHESMESFLDKVVERSDWLRMLDQNPELARCTIDIFEHSQYFSDQLVRHPRLLGEVEEACTARQGRTGFHAPRDRAELRRFFSDQMVRIQSDSIYHCVPVFRTLKRTSDLADSVISAAYEISLREAFDAAPAGGASSDPANQMMVIALGRLGMGEFDLASDADLIFVIPDSEAPETLFWTGVAERLINAISAYTGDGVVFSIDTRLRPNGREGPLVQTQGAYKEYFAQHAQAWEGITYMKARAVAGDVERGTAFLTDVQQIDWRRYGQGGRSRTDLAHMRARLEKEQGGRNPLKAGPGGYYDIDFVLMYLRLRGADLFYKVLNTPARIEVIEKMGHLDREDAVFLNAAATFYRAIDHGMRLSSGHAEGRIPTNAAQIAILTDLVARWTPPGFLDGTLESVTKRIRRDTRAFFARIFGPV